MDDFIPEHWARVMSPLGAVCHKIHTLVVSRNAPSDSEYEDFVMDTVRSDVYHGLRDDPLARMELGRSKVEEAHDTTQGPSGEEAQYFDVRTFPSGRIVGLFGVWPGRGTDVYAIAVDEKWPQFFGLYYRSCGTPADAERAIADLKSLGSKRNEELGQALVATGWYQLVPTIVSSLLEQVPGPTIRIPLPERNVPMPISDDLGRVLQDINGMMRAVVSSQSQLEDPTVRRTLTFLSQVILVVEQAFEDILTVLVDIQFLEDSPSLHTELRVLRKRVELLTARSYYRDAAEICSRLKHLRENYDNFIRPAVRHLPGFSDWQGLFGLIEEREGRIISLVERTAGHLALLLSQAESGDLAPLKTYSSQQTADLRSILSDLHTLNSRILGFSGNAGFLELTRDRNTLEREVNQVHVYQGEVNMGSRYQVGDVGAGARVAVGEHISWAEGVPKLPDGEELKHQFDALLERIATDSSLDEDTRELARTKTEAVAEGLVVAQASPGVLRRALLDAKSWFGGAASGIGLALSGILKSEAAQKTLGTVTEATTKAAIASFIG